jgi:pimeloyl-ACP methyl ester carboxylesterase
MGIFTMTIIALLLTISNRTFSSSTIALTSPCDNGELTISNKALPLILVHGYSEGSWVFSDWQRLLKNDGIPFCTITFHHSNDPCGSAKDHAKELGDIVAQVKNMTGQKQVNIVGYSKGGLDARVYLAVSGTHDVANLIMIGTPNAGAPLANAGDPCSPAVLDFIDHAAATKTPSNPYTRYYTIAGDWNPTFSSNCPQQLSENYLSRIGKPGDFGYENAGFFELNGTKVPNDGGVPVSSVESMPNSTNIALTPDCHANLLSKTEYNIAKEKVLMH